jgi:hypothetical protein
MLYFQAKIPIWVNYGGSLNGKGWCIIWPFGIYVDIWAIWYRYCPRFGIVCQEKSGNPGEQIGLKRCCRKCGPIRFYVKINT